LLTWRLEIRGSSGAGRGQTFLEDPAEVDLLTEEIVVRTLA
jgi:hypothetical protein